MAKRKSNNKIASKTLGYLVAAGLIIQFVFPAIQLASLAWISAALYLFVAIYLIFFK